MKIPKVEICAVVTYVLSMLIFSQLKMFKSTDATPKILWSRVAIGALIPTVIITLFVFVTLNAHKSEL